MTGIVCSMLGASFAAPVVGRTANTITVSGNAQVDTAQSKFGGASALFDGTGDYLQVQTPIALGSGDFTVECWIRRDDTTTDHIIVDFRSTEPEVAGTLYASNQTLIWYVNGSARITTGNVLTSTLVFYHVAVSRSGSSTKIFVDGTQQGSTYTDNNTYVGPNTRIGAGYATGASDYDGWIDEFRISNSARYTANFTAPTAAFVNDENTVLLVHADGADATTVFRDDVGNGIGRSARVITAEGGAVVSTAQSKFGGASAVFDGNTDALVVSPVSTFNWNNDFTVEMWIRMTAFGEQVFFDTREGSGGNNTGGYLVRDGGSVLRFYLNGTSIVSKSDPNITTNTWSHVAVTRSGNNFNLWIDGTSVSSATNSATGTAIKAYIGRNSFSATSGNTVGYIDEFRFSNIARYTTTFTPSTTAFTNDANTRLLLHMNGTNNSTVFPDDCN